MSVQLTEIALVICMWSKCH